MEDFSLTPNRSDAHGGGARYERGMARVVVVRDEALAGRVRSLPINGSYEHTGGEAEAAGPMVEVVLAPSFLSAMGELASSSADAVIGPASAAAGMAQSIAVSLRKLAPGARLLVFAGPEHESEAEQAVAAGFDAAVSSSAKDSDLVSALRLDRWAASGRKTKNEAEERSDSPPASTSPPISGSNELSREDDPVAWSVVDQQYAAALEAMGHATPEPPPSTKPDRTNPSETSIPPENSPAASDPSADPNNSVPAADPPSGPSSQPSKLGQHIDGGSLGDIDLVEAVMASDRKLQPLAVSVVLARSGIAGVGWCEDPAAAPEGHALVRVTHGGDSFGSLHAPAGADARQLEGWAGWLARWLALDQQVVALRELSMRDELTGVYNRRYFNRFLCQILDRAHHDRQQVTLLVFDIDDFKLYNDRYGHAAGDEVLQETARLMHSVVRDHDVVARIGGDEFAVLFWDPEGPRKAGSHHPQDVVEATQRFQQAVFAHRFPKLLEEAEGTLTISGGLAGYPWDGRSAEELLDLADQMAIRSKRLGKNVMTFGPGARRRCGIDETS